MRIEPPVGQQVKVGRNQDKPSHIESRRQYFDWLAEEIRSRALPGFESVERDTEYDDPKYRGAGIRLQYPVHTDYLPGIKEGVLLEVGFDDTAPNTPCLISSWALDAALASPVQVIDNRAVEVPCYSPAYTFVEKLQTVSTKFRLQQATDPAAPFPKNFLRHHYDLYCLLGHPDVLAFIGTPDYEARKRQCFRSGDELNIAHNPAFTLSEPAVRERYQCKYEETAGLYYAGQVPFAAILARIAEHIDRL